MLFHKGFEVTLVTIICKQIDVVRCTHCLMKTYDVRVVEFIKN